MANVSKSKHKNQDAETGETGTAAPKLELIQIHQLQDNKLSPRRVARTELVDSLAESLRVSGHQQQYALVVEEIKEQPETYLIHDGHMRRDAGVKAKLDALWCWVKVLTEEEALMEAALSNRQSEWSDLEWGIHILNVIELGVGGRGRQEGIREYARRVGRHPSTVSELRQAARVAETVGLSQQLAGRAVIKQLTEIAKAPEALWDVLCQHLISQNMTLVRTTEAVAKAREFEAIPQEWQAIFLPLPDVLDRALTAGGFEPESVQRLARAAQQGEDLLNSYAGETAALRQEYHTWLREGVRDYSWNVRKVYTYLDALRVRLETADRDAQAVFRNGDWRDFISDLPDQSVAAAVLDPPYGKHNRSLTHVDHDRTREYKYGPLTNDTPERAPIELAEGLRALRPKLRADCHLLIFSHWETEPLTRQIISEAGYTIRGRLIWSKGTGSRGDTMGAFGPSHETVIHATLGSPHLYIREPDVLVADRVGAERHPTEKPTLLLRRLIAAVTVPGDLVADLWGGVASTLVAARQLGRQMWGCEIDESYYEIGMERLWRSGEANPLETESEPFQAPQEV